MHKILFSTLIYITSLSFTNAQTVFSFGPEIGIATSGISHKSIQSINQGYAISKWTSIISPVVGITSELLVKKHLNITLGVQFQRIGKNEKTTSYYSLGTGEVERKIHFQKICIPLTIGYTFRTGVFANTVFTGIRPNFLIGGKEAQKIKSYYYNTSSTFHPLNKSETAYPPKIFQPQILLGFSTKIKNTFKVSLYANAGLLISYKKSFMIWSEGYTEINNNDLVLSFAYMFS